MILYRLFRIPAGRLFDYLCLQPVILEQKVAKYIRQLLDGVNYLHQCRIVHLDIQVILNLLSMRFLIFNIAGKSADQYRIRSSEIMRFR